MRRLAAVAAASLLAIAIVIGVILSASGPTRLGDNAEVGQTGGYDVTTSSRSRCTTPRFVPPGVRAIRILSGNVIEGGGLVPLRAGTVPKVTVRTGRAGPRRELAVTPTAQGARIAVPAGLDLARSRVCFAAKNEPVRLFGLLLRGEERRRLDGIGLIYEAGGTSSWLSRAGAVEDHFATVRGTALGGWTLWFGLLALGGSVVGALVLVVRSLATKAPPGRRTIVLVAVVGIASAGAWTLITPPLEAPDEPAHMSYVVHMGQHGAPPEASSEGLSEAWRGLQRYSRVDDVARNVAGRPPFTQDAAGQRPTSGMDESDGGVLPNARPNPVAYYAVAGAVTRVTGGDPFVKLALVRLLSALLFGVTAAGCALFVRELFASATWLAPVAGVLVALQPQAAFVSGSVNPDALLFAVGSLLLWRVAHAFRHGLTVRGGVVLGLLAALATASKLAGLLFLPGLALAGLVLAWRARRSGASTSYRAVGAFATAAAVPIVLYQALNRFVWSQGATGGGQVERLGNAAGSIGQELSYIWQFFLPRLPGMGRGFDGSPVQTVYAKQYVGVFGWVDTTFPDWVYDVGRSLLGLGLVALIVVLVRQRHRLAGRWAELGVYGVVLLSFLVLIGHLGYAYRLDLHLAPGEGVFEQTRYLFPLLALYGAVAVIVVRWAFGRFAPYVAVALVGLVGLQAFAGVLLSIGRYAG